MREAIREQMARPEHLPDFTKPPLDEVVLGVQFSSVPRYASVYANDIWALFKDEFPTIQEQPFLEPKFETFGGVNPHPSVQFQIGPPPIGNRLWFISSNENNLLQFQADRFIANWRKRPRPQKYPRFEKIAEAFGENLNALSEHFQKEFDYKLDINQAEIAYINIIPVEEFSDTGKWFKLWDGCGVNVEAINTSFNEIISHSDGGPFARLIHEIQSVTTQDGKQKALRLSLTFRGKPESNNIAAAMEFLALGRNKIVTRFDEITTIHAHNKWGKTV